MVAQLRTIAAGRNYLRSIFVIFVAASLLLPSTNAEENFYTDAAAQTEKGTMQKLEVTSDQGTFRVEVQILPGELERPTVFQLNFFDSETDTEIEDVIYEFVIVDKGAGTNAVSRQDQTATEQRYLFKEQGPYLLIIRNIENLGEDASIPIEVTPEFSTAILITVVTLMTLVFAARLTKRFSVGLTCS